MALFVPVGVTAKIQRAEEHLKALNVQLAAFVEAHQPTMRPEFDPETLKYTIYVQNVTEPPIGLGVLVGDVVHNLRSALDHLLWQIIVLSGGTPGGWNQWPIYDTAEKFTQQVTVPYQRQKRSPLLGVTQDTFDAIEAYQPYRAEDPQQHALAILRDLSNVDKHQIVHPSMFALTQESPKFTGNFHHVEVEWEASPIKEGAAVAHVTIYAASDAEVVEIETKVPVDIRFGEIRIPGRKFTEMARIVVQVIGAFCESFRPVDEP